MIRRPLVLLLASAAALVGLVILAVALVGIGTRTLQAAQAGDSPCLQSYAQDLPGSHVRYTAFPPRSICTFDVAGAPRSVVVASASPAAAGLGAVLALGGIAVCAGVLLAPRLRRADSV
ncbi:hypothetical protein [Cellulomonas sp. URHD0024]|uniref:hypothetical protein n=1 Tax=Cellulomonas sp. URHD0024 TaxID=1302620 RepID=UPI000427AF6E|nr:hypothetical protein [Cellulomonas sp. URHD0024]